MTISPEELAAFADHQLEGEDKARVAAAVEADPELARRVEAHRALAARLTGHFAPVLEQPVPDKLTSMLTAGQGQETGVTAEVVDFAAAREKRESRRQLPSWGWGGGAIAAALVAAVVFNTGNEPANGSYADAQLAALLDNQLVAEQSFDDETRILLSFRNEAGEYCRAYSGSDASGLACRDDQGWRQQVIGEGRNEEVTEFRMAGSEAEVLEVAQELAIEGALSSEEEVAARGSGWRD